MDNATARIVGSFFIAVTAAMPKEAARLASDVLLDVADDPRTCASDARILRAIAHPEGDELDEDTVERPRPHLEVIEGGNSAA